MPDIADGVRERQDLIAAGFGEAEISRWELDTRNDLADAGFSQQEVDKYFGRSIVEKPEPDMKPLRDFVENNLRNAKPEQVSDIMGALEAGFQMSVTGLIKRGQTPDKVVSPDAGWMARIASQAATVAGDLPYMWAGAEAGAAAGAPIGVGVGAVVGSVIPGAGTVAGGAVGGAIGGAVGGGAGAFALPQAMRDMLMSYYADGSIKSFDDFWSRASAILLDVGKSATIGAATGGAGAVAGKLAAPFLTPTLNFAAKTGAEVSTMVTVGAALEGQVPKAQDFLDAAVLVAGLGVAGHALPSAARAGKDFIADKLRRIYAETGLKPSEVLDLARENVSIKQDLNASNVDFPQALEQLRETPRKPLAGEPTDVDGKPLASNEAAPKPAQPSPQEPADLSSLTKGPDGDNVVQLNQQAVNDMAATLRQPATPKGKPATGGSLSDAEQAVLSRIKPSPENSKAGTTWGSIYRDAVDNLHPIKLLQRALTNGEKLPTLDNPYELARLTRGNIGRATEMIEGGTFDFHTLETTGKGLKEILEPFAKTNLDPLRAYSASRRAIELNGRGIETGIDLDAARTVVADAKPEVVKAHAELQDYQNSLLKYLRDSGVIGKEAYDLMLEANKDYVPFYRITEEGGRNIAGRKGNPVKAIKGSEKEIVDPIESIIRNTYRFVEIAENNRVLQALAKLADQHPENELIQKVTPQAKPVNVTDAEVARFLKDHGLPADAAEAFTIFRRDTFNPAKDEIAVYRDGKRELYKVPEDVAKAIEGFDPPTANLFFKMAVVLPARLLRAGATLVPEFIARNLIRDQSAAFVNSKGYTPFVDFMNGMWSGLVKNETYREWLKSGGSNAALVSIDRAYIERNIIKLIPDTNMLRAAWNVVTTPIEFLRVTSELIENATRIGEFKRRGGVAGDTATKFQAGLASREVTLDFARIGAKMRAVNQIVPFLNANVQGLDRIARTFKEQPVAAMAKMLASITLPSLVLWTVNHDDPRYKEIPQWQKDAFWIVMTDKHVYRIPKPQIIGWLFGSAVERTADAMIEHDPHALDGLFGSVMDQVAPPLIPTALAPFVEMWSNKSLFFGNAIVPFSAEHVLPAYQYRDGTSETAKQLGKLIAKLPGLRTAKIGDVGFASPAMIEQWIYDWSGGMGKYALALGDVALHAAGVGKSDIPKPAATLADVPGIKAFVVRYPSASAQSIQRFYDRYAENQEVINTIRQLAKSGNIEDARREMMLEENQERMIKLDSTKKALTTMQRLIMRIDQNPTMSPDEKRQLIDGLYYQMIEVAKAGNKMADDFAKAVREANAKRNAAPVNQPNSASSATAANSGNVVRLHQQ